MAEELTLQQKQAVTDRGGKLLVSAAAGSGKTKVLVDRLLSYVKDPVQPANLDEFLIITFTEAAAAELRGKIAAKLSQEIAAEPGNQHLRQQMQRLYLAKISTVHAFCGDILREYAYRLDIPGDFRIAEQNECLELQSAVIERILDHAYGAVEMDQDFRTFADTQGFGRNDRRLPEVILKLYNSAKCHKDPEAWLAECIDAFDVRGKWDISETVWGQYLINDLHSCLDLHIDALEKAIKKAKFAEGMEKPVLRIADTIVQLRALHSLSSWDAIAARADIDFGTLTFPRTNVDMQMAECLKAVRNACKTAVLTKLRRFSNDSGQMLSDIEKCAASARGLISLTRQFSEEYDRWKRRKRILDFSDLEHKALDLLLGRDRMGITTAAKEIASRFREVMVDEYQDTNEVQDSIFSAITQARQNCFMVGDVKQSIYQFRLADPGIFLEKYDSYVPSEAASAGQGRKILLSNNFRSGKGVIDGVNDVFTLCMSRKVGDLDYGADEMLYEGIPHAPLGEPEVELYGICTEQARADEAEFVASRISELLDGTHMIRGGDSLRPITPDDIAILLRSPKSTGYGFIQALTKRGIRVSAGESRNLLEAEEVESLITLLQVIDNPLQDIPMIAVLTSKVFCFTADELAFLRGEQRKGSIYSALCSSSMEKAKHFVELLRKLREKSRSASLGKLIKHIFTLTKLDSIYAAMPDGVSRGENLAVFYKLAAEFNSGGVKSLNRFLKYLDGLKEKGIPTKGEQTVSGAVTLQSIHKSKGLEYPVVFLPGLSISFNTESAYEQMLCDKEIGLGLSCVDGKRRIRYPSVAKRAISAKILADGLSEEMRILYVAMTRARDRLIMSYASAGIVKELTDMALRMDHTDPVLLNSEANCPGKWVLYAALHRLEAGQFFKVSAQPNCARMYNSPWKIQFLGQVDSVEETEGVFISAPGDTADSVLEKMEKTLSFQYPFRPATSTPSKLTATQLKGRLKDQEAAENAQHAGSVYRSFRRPSFVRTDVEGTKRGNAVHRFMEHISYAACADDAGVQQELERLVAENYITSEDADLVNTGEIAVFFQTEMGQKLRGAEHVLREFKFSILEDASLYDPEVRNEEILLQGVVDCAILEEDGITVVDFKTDSLTAETLLSAVETYRAQVSIYARALERIYKRPIKASMLYFFSCDTLIAL